MTVALDGDCEPFLHARARLLGLFSFEGGANTTLQLRCPRGVNEGLSLTDITLHDTTRQDMTACRPPPASSRPRFVLVSSLQLVCPRA